jgi:uncharacterized protein
VTVVLDSTAVIALYDRGDEHHEAAARWAELLDEDLVTSPLALADVDRAVADRVGLDGQQAVWRDFERGAYAVRWWADALKETLVIAGRHPETGLTRASLVALAGRVNTRRIATFDEQFRTLTTPDGEAFVVLPADR